MTSARFNQLWQSPSHPISGRGIYLLDSQTAVRTLLRQALMEGPPGHCITGEADTAAQAVSELAHQPAAVVIFDALLPDMSAQEFIGHMREHHEGTRLLLFSSWGCPETLRLLIETGVHGIVSRENRLELLFLAIDTLLGGGCHFALEQPIPSGPASTRALTEREITALCLIAKGFSTKEMASEMGITPKTSEKYRERLMNKLHLHDAVQLTRFAIRAGLVTP